MASKKSEPNPLFKKWLQDLFEEAKTKNSKLTNLLEEALNSISKYPVPLKSGAECVILKGFCKKLCLFLDQRLEVYYLNMKCERKRKSNDKSKANAQITIENKRNKTANEVHNDKNMADNLNGKEKKVKQKNPSQKSPKKYKPGFMTGAFIILVSLLKNLTGNSNEKPLTKEALMEKRMFCVKSFIRLKPNSYHSSMQKLLTKKLVRLKIKLESKKAEFKLSAEGIKLAQQLLREYENRGTTRDLKNKGCLPASQSNVATTSRCPSSVTGATEILPDETSRVEVWIEEGDAVRGPISLHIHRASNLSELRIQAELCLGIPIQLQSWIVGQTLCLDDHTSVESLAGPNFCTPLFCLVGAEGNNKVTKLSDVQHTADHNVYKELILLERCALVPNTEKFECGVCIVEYSAGEGVVLKECVHTFCRNCLSAAVKHCEELEVACPAAGCAGHLQEREIRALVSHEEYEKWLARGLAAAESVARHSFHCRTRDCTGWALCEPGVLQFPCPVCKHTNCVPCKAIHQNMTCDQHRVDNAINTMEDKDTKKLLNRLIERGKALACPECNTIIIRTAGCDWVRCSACKTEICWVTRGRRWGPGGPGDTSAGCRCRVNKRCHPRCRNCH